VEWRNKFKIATLTFKALETEQPPYLAQQLCAYAPTRALRSSTSKLTSSSSTYTNLPFGLRSFCASAATLWNSLPHSVRFCESLKQLSGSTLAGYSCRLRCATCVIASQYATSILNRCWSGFPGKWWYITFNLLNLKHFIFNLHFLAPRSDPLPQRLRFIFLILAVYKFIYLITCDGRVFHRQAAATLYRDGPEPCTLSVSARSRS